MGGDSVDGGHGMQVTQRLWLSPDIQGLLLLQCAGPVLSIKLSLISKMQVYVETLIFYNRETRNQGNELTLLMTVPDTKRVLIQSLIQVS